MQRLHLQHGPSARTRTVERALQISPHSNSKKALLGHRQRKLSSLASLATASTTAAEPVGKEASAGDASPAPSPAPAPDTLPPFLWERNWVPVTPISHLDPGRPTPITLLGQALVVWHHATRGWVVMRDACPHRLAPLSEGRLEAGGTRLACAYHGWEFSETGDCARVPQLSNDDRASATACASPRSCVATFPTLVKDGLLFAWLDGSSEGRDAARQAPEPQLLDEGAVPLVKWTVQEVPNDYSYWIEQGVDPAHANFLHHGQMGFLEDNFLPMPSQVVRDIDLARGYTWHHGAYEKKLQGVTAQRQFVPPFITRFFHDVPGRPTTFFCTIVVPVRPGVCRIYFRFGIGPSPLAQPQPSQQQPSGDGPLLAAAADATPAPVAVSGPTAAPPSTAGGPAPVSGPAPAAIKATGSTRGGGSGGGQGRSGGWSFAGAVQALLMRLVPVHCSDLTNLGSDQDVFMMSRQELLMRRQGLTRRDYALNSPADEGVAAANFWFALADYPSSLWGDRPASAFPGRTYAGWPDQDLPLERLLSRQDRHVRHCAMCQKGARHAAALCVALTAAAVVSGAVAAGLAMLAVVSPQGAAAAGGWGWVMVVAAATAGLVRAAVWARAFKEEWFGSGAGQWRRSGGFALVKKMA